MKHSQDLTADVAEVRLPKQIAAKVAQMGAADKCRLRRCELTLVERPQGSLPFMADLMRRISRPFADRPHECRKLRRGLDGVVGLVRILRDLSA